MRLSFSSLVLVACCGFAALAGEAPVETCPPPSLAVLDQPEITHALDAEQRSDLIDEIYETIRDDYLDPDLDGVDWDELYQTTLLQVMAAENDQEVYALLKEMVAPFEGNVRFWSPMEVEAQRALATQRFVGVGMFIDYPGGHFDAMLVHFVYADGPAEQAGLRRGDLILAVDGEPCPTVERIRGDEGTTVVLTVQSPSESPRDVSIVRAPIDASGLAPVYERLQGEPTIGYLRLLSLSVIGVDAMVSGALYGLLQGDEPLEGLIIDLRGTREGGNRIAGGVAGHLIHDELGSDIARTTSTPILSRRSPHQARLEDVPVVVLVDEQSAGVAELIAAAWQFYDRATVVGRPTAGETKYFTGENLFDGSRLTYYQADFALPDGRLLGDRGVTPDVLIDGSWLDDLASERDPFMEAALELLERDYT